MTASSLSQSNLRNILVVFILFVIAQGDIALTGFWHPNAPVESLKAYLLLATSSPTSNRLAHWNIHHKEWVRLVLGGGAVVMGLLILTSA